jgi:colicin import membrane protein
LLLLPNKELRKIPTEHGKGLAGTIIIHLVLLLLLVFVSFSVPPPPEFEEGIIVNFGTDDTGLGMVEPSTPAGQTETVPPPPSTERIKAEEEPLLTQNDEEAPEVKKIDPDAEKKKMEKAEAERIRKEALVVERKRKEQEETERKRIEAEQQRQADIINRTKNALAGSKNAGTNTTSEGITGGPGNQGVTSGSVDSKVRGDGGGTGNSGISYNLQGRGFQKLPTPKYDYQGEGRVVVEVSVDREGKVIQAIPGSKGSTTLDEYLLKVAKDAALEARFEAKPEAPAVQKGTITYNFILK